MNTLLICGSPRRNSNTLTALSEVGKALNAEGINTEIFELGPQPVRSCIGCGKCRENGMNRCVFNDDCVNIISEKAEKADAFIIGAPVYYGMPDGRILSLVQRLLYSNSQAFAFKPVSNVAICRRGGGTSSITAMNMPWLMVNCPIVPSQYWNIAYGREAGEAAFDAEGMQTMRQLGRNMAWMIHSLNRADAPQREQWNPTHFVRQDLK